MSCPTCGCGCPRKRRWVVDFDPPPPKYGHAIQDVSVFVRMSNQLIEDACKSLIMFGWATNEITRCRWPDFKETLRVGGNDVFEVTHSPMNEKYIITVTGRWVSWPYKY